ncbi:MAG: homocysteine S-methyltransferase [Chloroflexota bacterium]
MNPVERILREHPLIVLDGALATELERRGCDLNDPLWSAKVLLEQPQLIRAVHLDYFRAGADCAITASYQATIEGFARRGLSEAEAIQLMQKSVQLAREARDEFWADEKNRVGRPRPFIAASVGPYGAFLADGSEYRGDYGLSEAELIAFHRPRVQALTAAGADLLACETIPCMIEARALVKLLKEFPEACAWISFSAKDEKHVCHGEVFSECAAWLHDCPQVVALGINCTSPKYIPSLIREARKVTSKPILVYPNSGEVYDAATNTWHGETSHESFGLQSKDWHESGASLIGGCCRTTPAHIHEISAWARN